MFLIAILIFLDLQTYIIVPVLMFNISFVLGLGGLNLVYTTEIVSPKAVGICVSSQYLTTSLIGKLTPGLLDKFGSSPMIIFYGCSCMIVSFLAALYFVETQGKTEMELFFEIKNLNCGGVMFAGKELKHRLTTILRSNVHSPAKSHKDSHLRNLKPTSDNFYFEDEEHSKQPATKKAFPKLQVNSPVESNTEQA